MDRINHNVGELLNATLPHATPPIAAYNESEHGSELDYLQLLVRRAKLAPCAPASHRPPRSPAPVGGRVMAASGASGACESTAARCVSASSSRPSPRDSRRHRVDLVRMIQAWQEGTIPFSEPLKLVEELIDQEILEPDVLYDGGYDGDHPNGGHWDD